MKAIFTAALLLSSLSLFAQDLFVIKKSMNPKNVLHYKANVAGCKLQSPSVTPYWVMGESGGHTEGLTSREKPYFAPKDVYERATDADFTFGAMEKMGSKITDKTVQIRLDNCVPKAYLDLNGGEIQITEIYVSVNMLMSVKYMTITGVKSDGTKTTVRINN
ncbi:MAG: DUF4833 domain-containing protein [Bdellovibrionales bacterium]|nr:DUF4833 domain-containing protein [Bdellovibrionales bacterium]